MDQHGPGSMPIKEPMMADEHGNPVLPTTKVMQCKQDQSKNAMIQLQNQHIKASNGTLISVPTWLSISKPTKI
jgi:hypothetical protein